MFSKLTALVAEVVGLGPQQSRPENFSTHWRAITDCISSADAAANVSSTDIPHHLGAMAELLCEEDSPKDSRDHGTMGPCLEFLLRHRILDTLYTPCKNDYPSGIHHEVLMFLIHVLGRMEQPLLPHVSVHQAVQKLIQLCGLHPQSPLALKEIQFLRTLCLKVHNDARLADFLLADLPVTRSILTPPSPSSSSSLSFVSPKNGSQSSSSSSSSPVPTKTVYLVAEALQRLVNHSDNLVVMKAYECLLSCVSLRHKGVARVLASSHLPVLLASKLQYHFQLIPLSCSHTAIVGCNTGWGVDYASRSRTVDHSPSAHGLWHVEAYLSWLDYLEQAVVTAHSPLYQALCTAVQELLLEASLMPRILKVTEEDILLSTSVLSRSIQFITDESLLSEFVLCVLGKGGEKGGGGGGEGGGEGEGGGSSGKEPERGLTLRQLIIQRIDHPSDDVCQATLQLIDVLLQCPLAPVFLRELVFNGSPGPSTINFSKTTPPSPLPQAPHTPGTPHSPSHRFGATSTPLARSSNSNLARERKQLEHWITSYLSLVPTDLLSAEVVTGENGVEDYLIEAHKQVLKCRVLTQSWDHDARGGDKLVEGVWSSPEAPVSQEVPESPLPRRGGGGGGGGGGREEGGREKMEREGGEGPLVPALLSKLERLLDQSYEVNLLLTSVLMRLAAFSHPLIDTLFSPDSSSHNSVFSVLKKVSGELVVHAERSPGFQFNLREVRKRMVGQETSDLLSMPHNDLLEGAVVLEEFCKEVSCVLFAKHSTALLALPPCGLPSPASPIT